MNWPSLNSWTPRIRNLDYDAIQNNTGCQSVNGTAARAHLPPVMVCVVEHNRDASNLFNLPKTISYFAGPEEAGDGPQFVWPWAAWVSKGGVRVGRLWRISPENTSLGAASPLYPATKSAGLSGAYNNEGLLAIAIQKTDSSIEIKRYTSSTTTATHLFAGVSPVLYLNQLYSSDDPDAVELACYYLRPELPHSLFVRNEGENFAVEHTLTDEIPVNLSSLILAMEEGRKMVLLAHDDKGRDVTIYSQEYPVQPVMDKTSLGLSMVAGSVFLAAYIPSTILEKSLLSVSISGGSVFNSPTTPPAIATHKTTLSVSIDSGSYEK